MDAINISEDSRILLVWGAGNSPDSVKDAVNLLKQRLGSGHVQVENIDRLIMSGHKKSSFNTVVSGFIAPYGVVHSQNVLAEIAKVLKPGGCLYIREPVVVDTEHKVLRSLEKIISTLKLSGFVNMSEAKTESLSSDEENELKLKFQPCSNLKLISIEAKKPEYEVGSSSQLKLSFAKKSSGPVQTVKVDEKTAAVWSLSGSDMFDDDLDIIDSDQLLDEADLKKPDPASLRVSCADGPKKKKACKNCSCGLAEELEAETKGDQTVIKTSATSSCGSCYLGDAFRCASCPYLGMPAFKPGEKIVLSNRQLNADK